MSDRLLNFSAGPGTLPLSVIEQARQDLLTIGAEGAGICEVSHRGPAYSEVHEGAIARLKGLLGAGDDWELLFVQGGASSQFFQVPMNFGGDADYVVTGTWAKKSVAEAKHFGSPRVAASSEETKFDRIPSELDLNPDARYLHLTTNNTVAGTQWHELPRTGAPLVLDMSSDILSRPFSLDGVSLVYAGAQKNLGPAGATLVLVRKDFLESAKDDLPTMLSYKTHAAKGSRFNTPPVFSIYMVGLVAKWLEEQGGVAAMGERNKRKADALYAAIDGHDLYQGCAEVGSRSQMNVTFRLADTSREPEFISKAAERGLVGLKGHRSVGGIRASIYNAMPEEGVTKLVEFMAEFAGA
jgi:phosphoserine aminotransferase